MARISGYRSSWKPNKRPYVTITADAYITVQGETIVIGCGECKREIDINKFVTGISTEGTVDSPPGSATINLSIPDNQVNQFYVNDGFVLLPMMEIEIYAKGYYTVGGFPQYYRIFWGLISNVSESWSNGVTSVSIQCKDILRWWELTQSVVNPAFLDIGKTASGYNLYGNKFAGANPYTIILILAKESMGDFPLSDGSFLSFISENGAEQVALKEYGKGIMEYWQLKFSNIWNRLVLYGSSGQAYTFQGTPGDVTPAQISNKIFQEEAKLTTINSQTTQFKIGPHEIAAFKQELSRAGDVDFFQNEFQSKLSLALTARDQAGGYEFYCDTTGDIVFKPPFYNMNVIPNKPVSWIQDFEIIDDSLNDSEAEVFTHITSSGNAFGGVMDWGLNDEITTPRTGVVDYHLLRRYGWRRLNLQVEWAGNARKLFYHLLDHMDKVNAKRVNGTVTIPMRPELRMGFPIWFPKRDSFFYIQGISHNYSPGGQATTTLTLTAKRSKFIAPKNIGLMKKSSSSTYEITFPSNAGETSGNQVSQATTDGLRFDEPAVIRDPETGKLLGFPNAVMVYRGSLSGVAMAKLLVEAGSTKSKKPDGTKTDNKGSRQDLQSQVINILNSNQKAEVIDQLRQHRYEAGMTSAGVYDYAHDVDGVTKEFAIIPTSDVSWGGKEDEQKADDEKKAEERTKALEQLDVEYKKFIELQNKYADAIATQRRQLQASKNQTKKAASASDVTAATIASIKTEMDRQQQKYLSVSATLEKKKLLSPNTMVRPVSDEYGFEVIGHYRYGRGTFIDRGRVQISVGDKDSKNQRNINQLNVQFAATGGALTDVTTDKSLGPESVSFAKAFEELQPDDYRTGASFKGRQYNPNEMLESVAVTNQSQYTALINQTLSTQTGVYAEADAIRKAITLGELKPTFDGISAINGQSAFTKCMCGSSRNLWLSVLPKEFLRRMLAPSSAATTSQSESDDPEYAGEDAKYMVNPDKSQTGAGGLRDRAAALAKSLINFNSGAGPTYDKYKDWLFPPGLDDVWRANPEWDRAPSCALTARGLLRNLGLEDPELTSPYVNGRAIEDLKAIGRRHGSMTGDGVNPVTTEPNLKPGDILFVGKTGNEAQNLRPYQHTMIVNEVLGGGCYMTTEGGQHVYNGNNKITPEQEAEIQRLTTATQGVPGALTANQLRGQMMVSPGITGQKRCVTYQKGPLSPTGAYYVEGYPILFTIDLEKTFAEDDVADVEGIVESNLDASQEAYDTNAPLPDYPYDESGNLLTVGNNFSVDSAKFFDLLYEYLTTQFNENYASGNTPRERFAISGNSALVSSPSFEQDNILQPGGNTLFDRASQGDPDALNAMKDGINFNFGQSQEGIEEFKDQFQDGGLVDQLWQNTKDLAGQRYDPESGNFQPTGTSGASISTTGPDGQWSANTSDLLPENETAESLTEKAEDSGNTQSTKLPVRNLQIIQGKKNANLPKSMQKGQWQPKSHPTLRTKLNTTAPDPAEAAAVGPILYKD